MNDNEKKKVKKALLFVTAVILIYVAIVNFGSFGGRLVSFFSLFSPLLLGVVLSMLLGTPMRKFEVFFRFLRTKMKTKRKPSDRLIANVSLVLTFLLAGLVIYFVGNSVLPAIGSSFNGIFSNISDYYPKALAFLKEHGLDTTKIEELLAEVNFEELFKTLSSSAGTIVQTAMSTVTGVFSLLTNLVTAIIFAVYILANRRDLNRQFSKILHAYFRPRTAEKIRSVSDLVMKTFSRFFSGQCLEAIILGFIFFVAMSIFNFPYAVVISVVIGVTALIPYVGAFIGCIIGGLLILMDSPMKAVLFVAMFLVIQQLENHLIYPRVVGTSVGLPAIWTFAALIAGGALYGVVGMLLFIPATSVIYTLLKNDVNSRLRHKYGVSAVPEDAVTIDEAREEASSTDKQDSEEL